MVYVIKTNNQLHPNLLDMWNIVYAVPIHLLRTEQNIYVLKLDLSLRISTNCNKANIDIQYKLMVVSTNPNAYCNLVLSWYAK